MKQWNQVIENCASLGRDWASLRQTFKKFVNFRYHESKEFAVLSLNNDEKYEGFLFLMCELIIMLNRDNLRILIALSHEEVFIFVSMG